MRRPNFTSIATQVGISQIIGEDQKDVGAPTKIHNDNAQMETGTTWNAILHKYTITAETATPYFKIQNPAKSHI